MRLFKLNFTVTLLLYTSIATATIIKVPQDQPTIQAGIDAAADSDTILVDAGKYVENINFNGKNVVVGSLFLTTGDTSYISQTVIDGDSSGSVVTFESGEDSTASLIGFIITNGKGVNIPEAAGGGITCKNSSKPTLSHLIVKGNTNFYNGGGIHCRYGSFILRNSLITENISSMGGGIDCHWCPEPLLEKVVIKKNIAVDSGGGILSVDSDMILDNVIISENEADLTGGGILIGDGEVSLRNVLVSKNTVEFDGGGIYCERYSITSLESVTIADNSAGYGGGIYVMSGARVNVINAVLWNDSPEEIQFDPYSNPGTTTIAYSDVQGGGEGITTNNNGTVNWLEGNIESDPLFADPDNGDFSLQQGSPAIDAGIAFFVWDEDTIVNLPDTSYQGSAPDMGTFESASGIDYFPLNIGDERQYYWARSSGDTVLSPIETVSDTVSYDGKTYFSYSTHFLWVPSQYVRTDANGNVLMYFENEEGEHDETILFKYNVAEDDSYTTKPVFLGGSHFVVTAVSRNDTIISRAGSFPKCIQLWFQVPNVVDEDLWYWFAPEVGIVAIASEWYPISPLYYAKVGTVIYPSEPLALSEWQRVPPHEYRLEANYPNPFNPTTTIDFSLARSGQVTLTVYDLLGREVETILNQHMDARHHRIQWDASNVPSGIYLVNMSSGDFQQTRKVTVLR